MDEDVGVHVGVLDRPWEVPWARIGVRRFVLRAAGTILSYFQVGCENKIFKPGSAVGGSLSVLEE